MPIATTANFSPARRGLIRSGLTLGATLAVPGLLSTSARAAESPESRLQQLGIVLPESPPPLANYVAWKVANGFAYIAGQIPMRMGSLIYPGAVPNEVSVEQAREAARQCGINIIAALKQACDGDLNRVRGCMRLDGLVASSEGFTAQPTVINAASDLMVEVFGEAGKHTRTAVGVNELPIDACVEISAVFVID